MDKDWNSIKKVGLPALKLKSSSSFSAIYEHEKVLVQTKKGDMFVAKCRKTVYTNKKWDDEIEWFSYGTGGRKMKVVSKVIAWMELPDRYEGE